MKRNLLLLVALFMLPALVFSNTNWKKISLEQDTKNEIKLISSKDSETIIHVNINAYKLNKVQVNENLANIVSAMNGTPLLKAGAPDLPKITRSIIVPDNQNMAVEIVDSKFVELQNIEVAPSKGNFTRDIDPSTVPYMYGKEYQQNSFYPAKLASLSDPYILRDFRGQTVVFTPFQYNAVTKVLRIYTNFTIRVFPENGQVVNPLLRSNSSTKVVNEFANIYKRQFLNYNPTKYTPVGEDGEMLIICHPNFIEAMEPFVNWKIQRGMRTILENSTNYSNAAAIKNYISTYYAANPLSYVLIVGDAAFVPTNNLSSGESDNAYGYLSGNDSYSEVFVGRFSCETVSQCETMVERSIEYELSPQVSDFYGKTIGIGSSQGPGDDGEMDYDHIRNMHLDLMSFTYTAQSEFFDGSQGGLDGSGNPSASALAAEINTNGAGVILYTGHGSTTSFSTSNFSNSDINSLTNSNQLPFIWSVACVNGNFVGNTCFAEAWTRATYNNEPTGAIATLMSTINQSWNPPMHGQDEMVDILTESYSNNILRSFGGISMNGCMEMNDEYQGAGTSMADTWTIFGDPSVMLRTKAPDIHTVSHLPTVFIGANQFTVNCSLEDATVALTQGQTILGTAKVIGGAALVDFAPLTSAGIITVTVTGFNMMTYVGTIEIIPLNGPYVTVTAATVQDPTGNNNNMPDFSEDVVLDLVLSNVGIEMAQNVNGVLSTSDASVTITNGASAFGNIDSSAIAQAPAAFALSIADSINDQHVVNFELALEDSQANTWGANFSLVLNAPVINLEYVSVSDTGSMQNGRLDPGENVLLNLNGLNTGHAVSTDAVCLVSSNSPYVTIIDTLVQVGPLNINNPMQFASNIKISPYTPMGTLVDFNFELVAGAYSSSTSISQKVGLIVEDWETNDFVSYSWTNDNFFPWTITGTDPFEGSFTAKSGDINNNQSSQLILDIVTIADDSLSFYKKVSCEEAGSSYWDYLEFFVDNVSKGIWAGEIDWSKEQFWLEAGAHTLKWVYSKDGYLSEGDDCAWIDFIVLPQLDINYQPMFVTSIVDTIGVEYGTNMDFDIEAFDMNTADTLYFGASNIPSWMTITNNNDWTCTLGGSPDFSFVGFHDVELWLTDAMSDTVYLSFKLKVYDPVSAPEFSKQTNISVSPNPASNSLFLSAQFEQAQKSDVLIYNLLGEVISKPFSKHQFLQGDNRIEIPLENINSGIYLIEVSGNSLKWQQKIVITK